MRIFEIRKNCINWISQGKLKLIVIKDLKDTENDKKQAFNLKITTENGITLPTV